MGNPTFLGSNVYDESIGVNTVPTQPALVGLGVRDDLCLIFLTSLMLASSHIRARIRTGKGGHPGSNSAPFLSSHG